MITHWYSSAEAPNCTEEDVDSTRDWAKVTCFECLKSRPRPEVVGDDILERYDWKQVRAPQRWRPEVEGSELAGYYAGRTLYQGQYGPYEVALIIVPGVGAFTLSGVKLIQLIDASQVGPSDPVRVTWNGYIDLGGGKRMKDYSLYITPYADVADTPNQEEPEPAERLPRFFVDHA